MSSLFYFRRQMLIPLLGDPAAAGPRCYEMVMAAGDDQQTTESVVQEVANRIEGASVAS